jgi:hypothetical protein
MLPKALPVALVGVFPGANDILYALFTTIRGRVQPVVVAGAPHRASLALVSAAYAGGGAGFSCSNTDLFGPLRIVQYQYQMSIGATTAQVASTIYTATSPGTMKESKGPTITVKATFAEALGLTGC